MNIFVILQRLDLTFAVGVFAGEQGKLCIVVYHLFHTKLNQPKKGQGLHQQPLP